MSQETATIQKKCQLWLQALRLFSLPASVMPILLAASYAFLLQCEAHAQPARELLPLILLAGVSYHLGGNLISDYHDWKNGVDRPDTYGSSRVLVSGLLSPGQVLTAGFSLIASGTALGFILIFHSSWALFWFGLAACLGGIFYTEFKYRALGEILIFTLFGLLMVSGSLFTLIGHIPPGTWWLAIPLACLTTNILLANNIRDIAHDRRVPIKTLPILLGISAARFKYALLLGITYLSVIAATVFTLLPPETLIVLLSLPQAARTLKYLLQAEEAEPERIQHGDVMSAQLQCLFSLLLITGILIHALRGLI